MSKNDGWVSIHRKLWDNWIWKDKPFSKGQAWIDILLMVNHSPNKIYFHDELIEVDRAERITSETKLSERWGWSRTKVRNFLELLVFIFAACASPKFSTEFSSLTILSSY